MGFILIHPPHPPPHLIISPIVPTSHSIFYLLPVQGNLVIARQHVIINISSAEERSEMQPKIFVWSCLHSLLCSHSLRGAATHPSSGSHTEKGRPGSCRTASMMSQQFLQAAFKLEQLEKSCFTLPCPPSRALDLVLSLRSRFKNF